jgi:hypothetical protein
MRARTREEVREAIQLHHRMQALLADMATLPYGQVMNYNASGGRSSEHPGGKRPAGVSMSVEDYWLREWRACRTVDDGRHVVRLAAEDLEHWRKSKAHAPNETQKQLYLRIVRSGEGWPARECAAALRETVKTVLAAREAHGRDPAKGLPLKGADAQELLKRGNTVRYVEATLKVAKSTVFDRAKKAA